MRRFILLLMLSIALLTVPVLAEDISVFVNGEKVDFGEAQPEIVDGRTLVPLRATFEALGAEVEWLSSEQKIIANRESINLQLIIGQTNAHRNGKSLSLDVPAQIKNGRTLVPLRFVGEALDDTVVWDGNTQTITITSGGSVGPAEPPTESDNDKNEMTVHFIDVGQADSILVESPSGETMLIDAGTSTAGEKIVSYLKKAGISSIDWIVSTHPHADHIGGMVDVIEAFDVKNALDPGVIHTTLTFERYLDAILDNDINFVEARSGMSIDFCNDVRVEVLAPGNEADNVDLNNASIVLKMTYGQVSFLFTGDAEEDSEQLMLSRHGNKLDSTILKVGHHGSRTSTSVDFLKAVNPEIAVIQVGLDNTYGHPHQETLNKLAQAGVKILRTDVDGDIVITTDGKIYSINKTPEKLPIIEDEKPSYTIPVQPPTNAKININTASLEDLQEIIHIGKDRAQEIVRLRPFKSIDELSKVSGIGPARLADIKSEGKAFVD